MQKLERFSGFLVCVVGSNNFCSEPHVAHVDCIEFKSVNVCNVDARFYEIVEENV